MTGFVTSLFWIMQTSFPSRLATGVTLLRMAQALVAKGFEIDKRKIQLPDPLKALGEVTVPVKVHREVTAQVKVTVVAAQR